MKRIDQLIQVMDKETEFVQKLTHIIDIKQNAIVHLDSIILDEVIQNEEMLIEPLRLLESERLKLLETIANGVNIPDEEFNSGRTSFEFLIRHLTADEALKVNESAKRLKAAVGYVIKLNEQNKHLIKHSRGFIQESLRILTDNYNRQVIDQKI